MEASDLRLGNYVYFECDRLHMTTRGKVLSVRTDLTKFIDGDKKGEYIYEVILLDQWGDIREESFIDIEPIDLDEEWLLKFGFEYDNGFYVSPCHEFHTGIKTPFVIWNGDWNEVDKHYPIRKIHYVHQIQNLYFALTGKELELK